mmetsp:Transcript_110624/g.319603  ORF Transcript_110624/g.319603 Transcript_110624/m.319603 type:complete len:231 (+) Transcript_110624:141-833(+)
MSGRGGPADVAAGPVANSKADPKSRQQPVGDDEISFISDKAGSDAPLEYSAFTSQSSQFVTKTGGSVGAPTADSMSEAPPSETRPSDRRPSDSVDDAISAAHRIGSRGDGDGAESGGGGRSSGNANDVMRELRDRHIEKTPAPIEHRAAAASTARPPPPKARPPPAAELGPLVWIFNVTCCPAASSVAATDVPGIGVRRGASVGYSPPTDGADGDQDWLAARSDSGGPSA